MIKKQRALKPILTEYFKANGKIVYYAVAKPETKLERKEVYWNREGIVPNNVLRLGYGEKPLRQRQLVKALRKCGVFEAVDNCFGF